MSLFVNPLIHEAFCNPPPPPMYFPPYYFRQVKLTHSSGKYQILAISSYLAKEGMQFPLKGEWWSVSEVYSSIF